MSCQLGKIASLSKGEGISKDQRSINGNPCILYGELYTTYSTEIIDEVISKTNLPEKGLVKSKANDVIIPASGETAIDISTARCVTRSDVFLGGDLNIIRLKGQDGKFFSYQLNGVRKKDIAKVAQGVSIVHLHGSDLATIQVNYPSIGEQQKISGFLSLIDQRIAIQNRIIEKYESLIKGISSEVIGGKRPNTTLSNCVFCSSSTLKESELIDTGIPTYGAAGISGYTAEALCKSDSILITKDGSGVGSKRYVHGEHSFVGTLCSLTPKDGIYLPYVYFALMTMNLDTYKTGQAIPHIYFKDYGKLQLFCPTYSEQRRLSHGLETLDRKVEFEKNLLLSINEVKKGLLDQLFI
jgi:type I restriction enzyme S subunit